MFIPLLGHFLKAVLMILRWSFTVQNEPVGIADPRKIPNDKISAQSVYENLESSYRPEMADMSNNSSWCAYYNDSNQWLQMDFGQDVEFLSLQTGGAHDGSGKVTNFDLRMRVNATLTWQEKGVNRILFVYKLIQLT